MSTDFHHSNQVFKATLKKLCVDGLDQTATIHQFQLQTCRSCADQKHCPQNIQTPCKKRFGLIFQYILPDVAAKISTAWRKMLIFSKQTMLGENMSKWSTTRNLKIIKEQKTQENMDSKPRMYASGKEENNCPVKSLKLYLSKLNPDNELLFQQPKQKVKPDDEIWYTSRPVGAKTISGFMSKLSTDAKLSKRYTNHCIRATTITLLSMLGSATAP